MKAKVREFIEKNKRKFVSLNDAALIRKGASSSVAFSIKRQEKKILLATATGTLTLKATPQYGYIINLGNYGAIKDLRLGSHIDYKDYSSFVPSVYIYLENESLRLKIGAQVISSQKKGVEELINISKEVLRTLLRETKLSGEKWQKNGKITKKTGEIFIQSAGYASSKSSNIRFGDRSESLTRGLSILTGQNGDYNIDSYDTYIDANESKKFVSALAKSINQMNLVAVVATDDAAKSLTPDIRKKIYNLGLKKLAYIRFRDAYIGYVDHGNIVERRSMVEVMESLPAGEKFNGLTQK